MPLLVPRVAPGPAPVGKCRLRVGLHRIRSKYVPRSKKAELPAEVDREAWPCQAADPTQGTNPPRGRRIQCP